MCRLPGENKRWRVLAQMMARQINSPSTSSLGRLFDAVAALLGLRSEALYEGQAATELEALAQSALGNAAPEDALSVYPFLIGVRAGQTPAQFDVGPMLRAIVSDIQQGVPAAIIALRFHRTIAELLATVCLAARQATGLDTVALSGGVFQNRLLLEYLITRLEAMAFRVYINRRVPPNDGGLSLGQLAVAAARIQRL